MVQKMLRVMIKRHWGLNRSYFLQFLQDVGTRVAPLKTQMAALGGDENGAKQVRSSVALSVVYAARRFTGIELSR